MKIRKGFVSNSSSSSFCLYAACIELEEFYALAEKLGAPVHLIESEREGESLELSYEIKLPKGFECTVDCGEEPSYYIIGRTYESLKDDETGAEFKQSVVNFLKEHGIESKPKFILREIYI